jgi:hypothetical protein
MAFQKIKMLHNENNTKNAEPGSDRITGMW